MNLLIYLNYKFYSRFIRQGDTENLAIYSTNIAIAMLFLLNTFAVSLILKLFNFEYFNLGCTESDNFFPHFLAKNCKNIHRLF